MNYSEKYLQVDLDFHDIIKTHTSNLQEAKVHYFLPNEEVQTATGTSTPLQQTPEGEFIVIDTQKIRLDQIITLNGRPGPAYERYERFTNACLACEDLNQF